MFIWLGLSLLVVAYIALCLLVYFGQRSIVYHPTRVVFTDPQQARGIPFEDVSLRTEDGLRLSAWYASAEEAPATVLFCHGNGGNMAHRVETVRRYHDLGLSVLMFDYRGYGKSEGVPSEEGTYRDAEAAWKYLTEERSLPASRIVIIGRSLGSAVAAHLATRHTPGALVLEAAHTSAADVGRTMFPMLPVKLLARYHYDTRAILPQVECPVLVVHGRADRVIPFSHGLALYAIAPEPKEFLELPGGHMEAFHMPDPAYPEGLRKFIEEHVEERD